MNRMRIFVEPGTYDCLNVGDVAMLQVAVDRLGSLWPDATIIVPTEAPDRLLRYCPNVVPLVSHSTLPPNPRRWVNSAQRLARQLPSPLARGSRYLVRRTGLLPKWDPSTEPEQVRQALQSDLFVVSGGGYLNDAARVHSLNLLSVIASVVRSGIPAAMFGQGLGPVTDPDLKASLSSVLPTLALICLREGRSGPAMLRELGVPLDRIQVTGDDALDIAYRRRAIEPGNGLGISVRVARYSGIERRDFVRIRGAVRAAARALRCSLVPIPISRRPEESDVRALRRITRDVDGDTDSPLASVRRTARCRVVVTGTYHAAVFAVGQGIPTIGIAKSTYYADKLLGLSGQFPAGCEVVLVDDKRFPEKLVTAIERTWTSAPTLSSGLLESTRRQIEASQAAYSRLYRITQDTQRGRGSSSSTAHPSAGIAGRKTV